METWRYGDMKIWRYGDLEIREMRYEIGDMAYGIRIRDIGLKGLRNLGDLKNFRDFRGFRDGFKEI